MKFYEILKSIMDEKGISISEVARLSGLSDSTVRSIIDRKQARVALEVAFKLSNGLNVSLERLNGQVEKQLTNEYSDIEKEIISQYRKKPEMQQAVHTLLGIKED